MDRYARHTLIRLAAKASVHAVKIWIPTLISILILIYAHVRVYVPIAWALLVYAFKVSSLTAIYAGVVCGRWVYSLEHAEFNLVPTWGKVYHE